MPRDLDEDIPVTARDLDEDPELHDLLRACDEARYLGGDFGAAMDNLRAIVQADPPRGNSLKLEGCARTIKRHREYLRDARH